MFNHRKPVKFHIPIPQHYFGMANGNKDLLEKYIKGYVAKSYPELQLIRITTKFAVCIKRGDKSGPKKKAKSKSEKGDQVGRTKS